MRLVATGHELRVADLVVNPSGSTTIRVVVVAGSVGSLGNIIVVGAGAVAVAVAWDGGKDWDEETIMSTTRSVAVAVIVGNC